jgi:chorismate synthase
MSGNTFGRLFRITSFGESHGHSVGVIIDGCPPGLEIKQEDIQRELNRRRPGQSGITTQRKESDKVQILSGLSKNKSLGTPIALVVRNKAAKVSDYSKLRNLFRPGHADFTYFKKYRIMPLGGGRASGRETLGRVAAGAIAKLVLAQKNIKIVGHTKVVGNLCAETFDEAEIEKNYVRCADRIKAAEMLKLINKVKNSGDSIGGIIEVIVSNMPVGLGEPVFDKLDAQLAKALVSIGGVKGVEFGNGFELASMFGSQSNDEFCLSNHKLITASNKCGGVLGGISTGNDLIIKMVVKPTPSISKPQKTVDVLGKPSIISVNGMHDPCICPRLVPVAEAMVAIVLTDFLLINQSLCTKDLMQAP